MDWLISFLAGYVVRLIKERGSDQWLRENATVYHSTTSHRFPGGLAEIIYSYSHKGQYFSGTHERQFVSYFDAKRYVAAFPKAAVIVVRVKPGHPKISIMLENDQDQVALKLKTRFD